jgi:hypothetical protein
MKVTAKTRHKARPKGTIADPAVLITVPPSGIARASSGIVAIVIIGISGK